MIVCTESHGSFRASTVWSQIQKWQFQTDTKVIELSMSWQAGRSSIACFLEQRWHGWRTPFGPFGPSWVRGAWPGSIWSPAQSMTLLTIGPH